jgi:hypothetical protein
MMITEMGLMESFLDYVKVFFWSSLEVYNGTQESFAI